MAAYCGHGFLLFERADFHLRRECAAGVNRGDQPSAETADGILEIGFELDDITVDGGDTAVENDSRQAGGLGFADPVERRRHPPLGGNHVRPALQRFQRHADGHRAGQRREIFARRQFGGWIAAQQQFQRPQGLLMGEANLFGRVLKIAQIRPRQSDILFAAGAHLLALFGKRDQTFRGFHHVGGELHLQPCFAGGEPAFGGGRRE